MHTAVLKVGALGGCLSCGLVLVPHMCLQALGGQLQLQMRVPPWSTKPGYNPQPGTRDSRGLYIPAWDDLGTVERCLVVLGACAFKGWHFKVCTAVLNRGAPGGCGSCGKVLVPHSCLQAPRGATVGEPPPSLDVTRCPALRVSVSQLGVTEWHPVTLAASWVPPTFKCWHFSGGHSGG